MTTLTLDLKSCSGRLAYDLGEAAPAYVTLRRWVASGQLAAAEKPPPGGRGRMLYIYEVLKTIVLSKTVKSSKGEGPSVKQATGSTTDPEVAQRLAVVEETMAVLLTNQLNFQVRFEELMTKCLSGVDNLDGVRKALMNKYDAQASNYLMTIENQMALIKQLKSGDDNGQFMLKLAIGINGLKTQLDAIHGTLREAK